MDNQPIRDDEMRVNVTYGGANGDLPDPVSRFMPPDELRRVLEEALRTGGVMGIAAQPNADLTDFMFDRFDPTTDYPFYRVAARPKVPFGR